MSEHYNYTSGSVNSSQAPIDEYAVHLSGQASVTASDVMLCVDKTATPGSAKATITWRDVNVSLPTKKSWWPCKLMKNNSKTSDVKVIKPILNKIDGIAKPNEILAIMGSSGAGKTTLMNVLNFRNKGLFKVAGEIRLNGVLVKSPKEITSVSAYLQQDDVFLGFLTVSEHLFFQAMLRMSKETSRSEKISRIDEVIRELNLDKCRNNMIGVFGMKGISGGERKRLSFASEILNNPSILFCDEPTSGLDSYLASSIVENMKNLASKGMTIICTIHQPSSEIFQMFDKLCLLAEGRLAYFGELSRASDFFRSQNYILPPNYNPADFYIKILSANLSNRELGSVAVNKICDGFKSSQIHHEIIYDIESSKTSPSSSYLENLASRLNRSV